MSNSIEVVNLNEVLLSSLYEDDKKELWKFIIEDIGNNTLTFSNTKEYAERPFFKDKELKLIIEDEEFFISYGNYLTLLIVAKPFNEFKEKFTKDFMFNLEDVNDFSNYYTKVLKHFDYSVEIKETLTDVISECATLTGDVNLAFGNTVSIKQFLDLAKVNEEFNKALYFKLPEENLTFDEIEKIQVEERKKVMQLLRETDNGFQYFIKSGSGVSDKQFSQVISIIGSKPDLFGNIIPRTINTSFLRGLDGTDFFINAVGARKALITNFNQVRDAGYLTRKISTALIDTHLANIEDCGNHPNNFIGINIENEKILKRLSNRNYFNFETEEVEEFDLNNPEKYIGKMFKVASPITCASEKGICNKCYGSLFKINNDLNVGIIATLLLTDPLTQRLLSAKHLLETRSDKIEWGEEFENFFNINRNLVIPKNTNTTLIINADDYAENSEIETEEHSFQKFTIKQNGKFYNFNSPLHLILAENVESKLTDSLNIDNNYEIQLKFLEEGEEFAYFIMENNELSKPLKEIKSLIETNNKISELSIEECTNYFLYLLNEAGINIQSVHIELILREMLSLQKGFTRESFKKNVFPPYTIYRITDSILKGDSLARSLLYQDIKNQLVTLMHDTYEKEGESVLDILL